MGIVIDSSVAACWALPDEYSELANRALDDVQTDGMNVPPIFWYEVRNVLIVNERRNRIVEKQVNEALTFLDKLPQRVDAAGDSDAIIRLARSHRLTIYDAAYLELALRRDAPLATLDRRLTEAARAEGVMVIE